MHCQHSALRQPCMQGSGHLTAKQGPIIKLILVAGTLFTVITEGYPREVTVRAEGRLVSLLAPRSGCRLSTAPGLVEVSPSGSSLPFLNILLPTCMVTHTCFKAPTHLDTPPVAMPPHDFQTPPQAPSMPTDAHTQGAAYKVRSLID